MRLSRLLCSLASASVGAFPPGGGRWLAAGQTDEGGMSAADSGQHTKNPPGGSGDRRGDFSSILQFIGAIATARGAIVGANLERVLLARN